MLHLQGGVRLSMCERVGLAHVRVISGRTHVAVLSASQSPVFAHVCMCS